MNTEKLHDLNFTYVEASLAHDLVISRFLELRDMAPPDRPEPELVTLRSLLVKLLNAGSGPGR